MTTRPAPPPSAGHPLLAGLLVLSCLALCACSRPPQETTLAAYDLETNKGLLTLSGTILDFDTKFQGRASARFEVPAPVTIRLFETGPLEVESARLVYRAHLKTRLLAGRAYLEMWCVFPQLGEYFSRSLETPVAGLTDWVTVETPFFLQAGQKPAAVRLNLVVEGRGTVWIDDIRLLATPF